MKYIIEPIFFGLAFILNILYLIFEILYSFEIKNEINKFKKRISESYKFWISNK